MNICLALALFISGAKCQESEAVRETTVIVDKLLTFNKLIPDIRIWSQTGSSLVQWNRICYCYYSFTVFLLN